MSIANEALLVNLQVGVWSGHRLDKEATRKVTEEANAESDAARVNKHLVPKATLKNIVSTSNAIRLHFYANTLPWKDNGDRLLTRLMYTKFIEEHEKLAGEFRDAVKDFLATGYPAAVEQAGFRMGDLFDISDYPEPRELQRKFYVNLDVDAVAEAGDFRVQMDDKHIDSIRKSMEAAMEQRIAGAMRDVWERLAKVVGHLAERLGDEDRIFRNSTLTNLEDLVDVLPGLNVLNDPDLEKIRRDIKKSLYGLDVTDLRKFPEHRKAIAGEAQRIMDTMGGFMSAFGN